MAASGEDSYFAAATEVEACLLLGDEIGARTALERAAQMHGGDYGALSTTRRQLRMICAVTAIDPDILSALAGPAVAHYCGHRMARHREQGRLQHAQEEDVAARMALAVERRPAGYAYGSLASGGDILWAEALMARGCELHVVLPFALEEFIATSVAPAGAAWMERFHRCLEAATSVNYATVGAYLGDDVLYSYCAEFAMGLALVRARHLDSDVHQLALWDGEPPTGVAGTAADVARWKSTGHDVVVVAPWKSTADASDAGDIRVPPPSTEGRKSPGRVIRAMLIGDISGFSKLSDEQLPMFAEVVLGAFARVLGDHDTEVEYRNTWGDALYAVLSGAPAAAALCPRPARGHGGARSGGSRAAAPPRLPTVGTHRPGVPHPGPGVGHAGLHGIAREPHRPDRARDPPGRGVCDRGLRRRARIVALFRRRM